MSIFCCPEQPLSRFHQVGGPVAQNTTRHVGEPPYPPSLSKHRFWGLQPLDKHAVTPGRQNTAGTCCISHPQHPTLVGTEPCSTAAALAGGRYLSSTPGWNLAVGQALPGAPAASAPSPCAASLGSPPPRRLLSGLAWERSYPPNPSSPLLYKGARQRLCGEQSPRHSRWGL